jgi:hypothetical protein
VGIIFLKIIISEMGKQFLNIGKLVSFCFVDFCSRIPVDGADANGTIHPPQQWCRGENLFLFWS